MASRAWKAAEKGVATLLGGERVSNTALGMQSSDVETPAYSIEVKSRKVLPAWIEKAVEQAHRNAPRGKLPLVVLHKTGTRRLSDLVVVRMSEFVEWFGEVNQVVADD